MNAGYLAELTFKCSDDGLFASNSGASLFSAGSFDVDRAIRARAGTTESAGPGAHCRSR